MVGVERDKLASNRKLEMKTMSINLEQVVVVVLKIIRSCMWLVVSVSKE